MCVAATNRTYNSSLPRKPSFGASARMQVRMNPHEKSCPLCKQAGRQSNTHFLSMCKYLPEQDRQFMLKARQIVSVLDEDPDDTFVWHEYPDEPLPQECPEPTQPHTARTLQVWQSPYIDTFYKHHHARIILDTGATCNMIRLSATRCLGAHMTPSSQSAHQADGSSPMKVVGETRLTFSCDTNKFHFDGLVVENLDVDILAGTPFMSSNDISVRPAKRLLTLAHGTAFPYSSADTLLTRNAVRRTIGLRAPPTSTTIWPGEFAEICS